MNSLVLIAGLAVAALGAAAGVTPLPGVTPQRAQALVPLQPIAVRVTDAAGAPVPGAIVTSVNDWRGPAALAGANGCGLEFLSVYVCTVTADGQGIARFPAMASQWAGTYEVTVQAVSGTTVLGDAKVMVTADPVQDPARLTVVGGSGQTVVIGTPLSTLSVKLQSASGVPLPSRPVSYSPWGDGGRGGFPVPDAGASTVDTDANGVATLPPFTAGWALGDFAAEARYVDEAARAIVTLAIPFSTTNAQGGRDLDLSGLWWSGPAESGWGIAAAQHGTQMFNVFFVYDDAGHPTWFVQPGGTWPSGFGYHFDGKLYGPRGTPWYAYDASRLQVGESVGSAGLLFRGPDAASMGFNRFRGTSFISTQKALVPQSFGRGVPAPITGVADLWWGGPSQNGWGLAIAEQGGTLFMVWFTYDNAGMPTWFVMPGGEWTADGRYAGTVYRTRGPMWEGVPFDASKVSVVPVGRFSLRFSSPQQAAMEVTIDDRGVTLDLVRQPF